MQQPPPAAPAKTVSGGSKSTRLVAMTSLGLDRVVVYRLRRLGPGIVRLRQLPSRHALQYAIGMLDRVHMPVVLFNHVDGSTHLLSEEIYVHAFPQPQRGVGVPEVGLCRARHALRAFAQIRFV